MIDNVRLMVSEQDNQYTVTVGSGSSVQETAFCIGVIIRCLLRDEYITNVEDFLERVKFYSTDEQFKEIEEVKNEETIK